MKYSAKMDESCVINEKSHYSKSKKNNVINEDKTSEMKSSIECESDYEETDVDSDEMSNTEREESTSDEDLTSDIHADDMSDITSNHYKHDSMYDVSSNFEHETKSCEEFKIHKEEMSYITLNNYNPISEYDISNSIKNEDNSEEEFEVLKKEMNTDIKYDISSDFKSENDLSEVSDIPLDEINVMNEDDSEYNPTNVSKYEISLVKDSSLDVDYTKNKHKLSDNEDIQMADFSKNKVTYSRGKIKNAVEKSTPQMAIDKEILKYKCCMCNEHFKLKHHLNQHILTHTNVRAKMSKTHKCKTCSKAFKLKHHLQRHILTHTGEKAFNCSHCNKSYVDKYDLKKHISKMHLIKNNKADSQKLSNSKLRKNLSASDLTCDICGKVFSARRFLVYHIRTHLKMTSFVCDICGKAFRFNASLVEHSRSHSKDKPFKCDICNKAFSTKSNLVRHEKSHFQKRRCNSCDAEFVNKEEYQSHLKTCNVKGNKQVRCDMCGWDFKKLSNLKRHLTVHHKYSSKSEVLENNDEAIK